MSHLSKNVIFVRDEILLISSRECNVENSQNFWDLYISFFIHTWILEKKWERINTERQIFVEMLAIGNSTSSLHAGTRCNPLLRELQVSHSHSLILYFWVFLVPTTLHSLSFDVLMKRINHFNWFFLCMFCKLVMINNNTNKLRLENKKTLIVEMKMSGFTK